MHSYSIFIVLGLFLMINCKPLSDKSTMQINQLIQITKLETIFNTAIDEAAAGAKNTAINETEMRSMMKKLFSFESLRPGIVQIYQDVYTAADIKGLIKFYSTPFGKSLVPKALQFQTRFGQLMAKQMQEKLPQITAHIQQKMMDDFYKKQMGAGTLLA